MKLTKKALSARANKAWATRYANMAADEKKAKSRGKRRSK